MSADMPTNNKPSLDNPRERVRQLAIVKRTDLSFYEGWDDCYVDWLPASYSQANRMIRADYSAMTDEEATRTLIDAVKERIVAGKVRVLEGGKTKLVDIKKDDVDSMPSVMVDRLYGDMAGLKYDADPLEETETETQFSPDTDSTKHQEPTNSTETQ